MKGGENFQFFCLIMAPAQKHTHLTIKDKEKLIEESLEPGFDRKKLFWRIQFSKLFDLVNKRGLTALFTKSRFGCIFNIHGQKHM